MALVEEFVHDEIEHAMTNVLLHSLDVEEDVGVGDVVVPGVTGLETSTGNGGVFTGSDFVGNHVLELRDDPHRQWDRIDTVLRVQAPLA